MARYTGVIGLYDTVEVEPGIWEDIIKERRIVGNIDHISRRYDEPDVVHEGVIVTMVVSFIHNQDFNPNQIRYISYMGVLWGVNTIEFKRPRVTLHFGGVWNGQTASSSQ